MKPNAQTAKLETILPENLVEQVRAEAEISMGTDITELDLIHIRELCDQIIELSQYRAQLHEYLKNRMNALAPNLTVLLGELIGARLISKAGGSHFFAVKFKKIRLSYGIGQMSGINGANIGCGKSTFPCIENEKGHT